MTMPDMTDAAIAEVVKDLRELYAHMFAEMATYAPDCIEKAAAALEQQARDLAAARNKEMQARGACQFLELELATARRENAELRGRTIEEIAQFIENEPIHSWVPRILAERIGALTKSSK